MMSTVIEVVADGAHLYVERATGNVLDCVYISRKHAGKYDDIAGFNPLCPALLMAEPWDEVPLHALQKQATRRAVA